jgi:thiol-disulfide isomerase/thioredoxin
MFKSLRLLTLLSIFLTLILSFSFANCSFAGSDNKTIPVKEVVKNSSKTVVYYFYAKPRCISCKKIETYTKEAVSSLNNSKVEFKTVDLDQPENKHYKKQYKLYTKSVVLSKVKNGKEIKSKNLTQIWTKLGDEKAFKNYVTKEIKSF